MRNRNLLEFDGHRYLKVAAALLALAALAYALHRPPVAPYGGTWLGYTLGTAAALMMLGQLWLAVRRRRYDGHGRLQAWISAHVYFGIALVVLATLHSGFQVHLNVHGLSYLLLLAMAASGAYGVFAYLRIPRLMTENMGDDSFAELLLKIADLDERARAHALHLPDATSELVMKSIQQTVIGGSVFRQLRGHDPECPTQDALRRLHGLRDELDASQSQHQRELYSILLRKESLLIRARQEVAFRARLEFWMYLHAPLAAATIAALSAHVVATLWYR
jgi:hypothetical protein